MFVRAQNDTHRLEELPAFCLLVELGLEEIIKDYISMSF